MVVAEAGVHHVNPPLMCLVVLRQLAVGRQDKTSRVHHREAAQVASMQRRQVPYCPLLQSEDLGTPSLCPAQEPATVELEEPEVLAGNLEPAHSHLEISKEEGPMVEEGLKPDQYAYSQGLLTPRLKPKGVLALLQVVRWKAEALMAENWTHSAVRRATLAPVASKATLLEPRPREVKEQPQEDLNRYPTSSQTESQAFLEELAALAGRKKLVE